MVPLALLLVAGCMPEKEPPAVELDLTDDGSTTAAAEYHRTQIRLRELPPSVGYPHGLMVASFQLRRHSGVRAEVMLEVPVQVDASSAQPRASYTEHSLGSPVFQSARVAGRIELSWDAGCPCQTGRFELLFTDPGPDGVLDTDDDQQRRLTRARLRRGSRPFCHARSELEIHNDVLVVGSRACPVRRGSSGGEVGAACAWGGTSWVTGWNDDGWYDEEWVGEYDDGAEDGWCEEWTDECQDCGYSDDGWSDDGWGDDWGSGGSGSSGGWGDDDWGDDDWGDDDWGDDDWGDDGWDDGGDDGWDDGGDDDGDDWGDDWWDD